MGKTDLGSTAHDLPEDEPKEFWPDPWLDYTELSQRIGNKPLSVLLTEMVVALEAMIPCEYIDHVQGTNVDEWRCPACKEVYTSVRRAYCNCKAGAVIESGSRAAEIVKVFLDESAAELLDRGYTLDKGTCMAHHTDSMGVKATRRRLFNDAAESFAQDRLMLKLED